MTDLVTIHDGWYWFALMMVAMTIAWVSSYRILLTVSMASAIAALASAIVTLSLFLQVAIFLAALVIGLVLYFQFWYVPVPNCATQKMRKRAYKLVGAQASLLQGIKTGKGRAQIADAVWVVRCETRLPTGALVKVVGYNGAELEVVPGDGGRARLS